MHSRAKELLNAEPFVPFSVTTSVGESYEVVSPESAWLTKTFLFVSLPSDKEVIKQFHLSHIAAIETPGP